MYRLHLRSALIRSGVSVILGMIAVSFFAANSVPQAGITARSPEAHSAPLKIVYMGKPHVVIAAPRKVTPPRRTAPILLPVVNQKDIESRHRVLGDRVLRALPASCREPLRNFYVNYDKNVANRGLGGESTIIVIGTVPDDEFIALIVHECGHVADLGGLRGSDSSGYSDFYDGNTPIHIDDQSVAFYQISWLTPTTYRPNAKASHFVSGYASVDPFEDFAETYAYYALQREAFRKLAETNTVLQAKYDFMEQVVFAGTPAFAEGAHVPGAKVPWDITKLPYVWHAKK